MIDVYTDGACSGNPGPGGWAWAVDEGPDGRRASGGDGDTTNQRMELTAVLKALRALDGVVTVHSDSTYVVNAFNDRWYDGWLKRGWKNSNRKPVANRDLWEPLVEIFQQRNDELSFVWVKGHAGDPMNELVDRMAVAEVDALKSPDSATGGDGAEASGGPLAPWPAERAIVVTGVRELDGDTTAALVSALSRLQSGRDILVSGLRRGAELQAAEQAIEAGIPLAVVLPFADPARRWPSADRDRFEAARRAAEWEVVLDGDPARPQTAVVGRDRWLTTAVVGAIVVDDEAKAAEWDQAGLGVVRVETD